MRLIYRGLATLWCGCAQAFYWMHLMSMIPTICISIYFHLRRPLAVARLAGMGPGFFSSNLFSFPLSRIPHFVFGEERSGKSIRMQCALIGNNILRSNREDLIILCVLKQHSNRFVLYRFVSCLYNIYNTCISATWKIRLREWMRCSGGWEVGRWLGALEQVDFLGWD